MTVITVPTLAPNSVWDQIADTATAIAGTALTALFLPDGTAQRHEVRASQLLGRLQTSALRRILRSKRWSLASDASPRFRADAIYYGQSVRVWTEWRSCPLWAVWWIRAAVDLLWCLRLLSDEASMRAGWVDGCGDPSDVRRTATMATNLVQDRVRVVIACEPLSAKILEHLHRVGWTIETDTEGDASSA